MIQKGGRVTRFHTLPTLKPETVAEHSYLVAWLCTLLSPGQQPAAHVLLAALAHDLPEYDLGDMPSPTKIRLGVREQFRAEEAKLFAAAGLPDYEAMLTDAEAELLKFCDNMAGYLKCMYELSMGNTLLADTAKRYADYMATAVYKSEFLDKDACIDLLLRVSGEQS